MFELRARELAPPRTSPLSQEITHTRFFAAASFSAFAASSASAIVVEARWVKFCSWFVGRGSWVVDGGVVRLGLELPRSLHRTKFNDTFVHSNIRRGSHTGRELNDAPLEQPQDWICTGTQGDSYSCHTGIFNTYLS
jgi:hypothetical protein